MNLSIMDPGLYSLAGHHFDHDFRLAKALQKLGCSVQVHSHISANKEVEAAFNNIGIQVTRTFRVYSYTLPPSGEDDLDFWLLLSRKTEEDLRNLAPTEIAFWPSLCPVQILALTRQPYGQKILGGLDGSINGYINGIMSWGPELIARSALLLKGLHDRIILGTYDWRMADIYGPLLADIKIMRLPVPYDRCLQQIAQPGPTLSRIGFFGHQRVARGTALLPQLARELIDRGKSVIIHDCGKAIGLKGSHPKLKIQGFVEDMSSQIAACDLIVWPSDPSGYTTKTSGIVWSSIAAGIPMALPPLCLPARIAHENGAAVFFAQNSVPSILEAIKHAEDIYPSLVERAIRKARDWSVTEGVDHLAVAITSNDLPQWR